MTKRGLLDSLAPCSRGPPYNAPDDAWSKRTGIGGTHFAFSSPDLIKESDSQAISPSTTKPRLEKAVADLPDDVPEAQEP